MRFNDLDVAVLKFAVISNDGEGIPAGTEGTIVGVWQGGASYEVEFVTLEHGLGTLATVGADQLGRPRPKDPL